MTTDYPPARALRLSEMKTLEESKSFLKQHQPTKRKVRRRGLNIAQQGLAKQKKERFKIMQKKYGDLLLDEEVKDDQRQSKGKGNSVRTATNESAFKKTGMTTPNKNQKSGGTSSKTSLMN